MELELSINGKHLIKTERLADKKRKIINIKKRRDIAGYKKY